MKQMCIVMNKDSNINNEWLHLGNKIIMNTNIKPCLFKEGEITLLFDGNLLNFHTLFQSFYETKYGMGDETKKLSLLIDIYIKCGIHYLLKVLDGSFAFVLLDQRVEYDESRLYVISDSMGLRPIYSFEIQSLNKKTIYGINTENEDVDSNLLNPGKMCVFKRTNLAGKYWEFKKKTTYFSLANSGGFAYIHSRMDIVYTLIHNYLYNSVEKRCLVSCHIHNLSPNLGGSAKQLETRFAGFDDLMSPDNFGEVSSEEAFCPLPKETFMLDKSNVIFCIVSNHDIESKLIAQITKIIFDQANHANDEVVKISIDHLLEMDKDENLIAKFVYEKITEYLSKYNHTPINYHVFASSGMMNIEKGIQIQCNGSSIQYDYDFRKALWTIGSNDLIPNTIEPFKRVNLEVEFPFLDTEWLNFYMSISPQFRLNKSLIEDSLEEHI